MLLRESGADLKTIQERLRYTKLDTTANIYTHKSEAISRAAADQLEELNPKSIKFAPSGESRQPFVENRQKKNFFRVKRVMGILNILTQSASPRLADKGHVDARPD
jgi:hypothetical protein